MSDGWPDALRALLARDPAQPERPSDLGPWLEATGETTGVLLLERVEPAADAAPDAALVWRVHAGGTPGDGAGAGRPDRLEIAAAEWESARQRGFAAIAPAAPRGPGEVPGPVGPGERALFVPLPGTGPRWAALVPDRPGAPDAWRERRALVLNLGATALARARDVARLRRSESRLDRELRDVARIQRLLLPSEAPPIRGLDVAARLDGFGLAAGDYYDYGVLTRHYADEPERLPEDYWSVIIADVTGHGAAAAVEVAMFDALLRAYSGLGEAGPAEALTFVNDHFFTRLGRPHFVTSFAALFDPEREEIRYCNAGHPPPLLVRSGRERRIEWVRDGDDIPVGVVPEHRYQGARRPFGRDDLLVLYTDGVIEATSPSGEQFGPDRLAEAVAAAPRSPREMIEAIRSAVAAHEGGCPPRDDRTLLVARRCSG